MTNKDYTIPSLRGFMANYMDCIDVTFHAQSHPLKKLTTGFDDFDCVMGGLQPGSLQILGGASSMGKTTFALNICEYVAIKHSMPVIIFSFKLSGEEIVGKFISSSCRIDSLRLKLAHIEDEDWPRISSSITMFADKKIFIEDSPFSDFETITKQCFKIYEEHGTIGLIVFDSLQLMSLGISDERRHEVEKVIINLKALAKKLNVPIILTCQLNRKLESRINKRPILSDLYETSLIESLADSVVFIYRDEVYNENSPDKETAEITIAKQKNGPIHRIRLNFSGQYSHFANFKRT